MNNIYIRMHVRFNAFLRAMDWDYVAKKLLVSAILYRFMLLAIFHFSYGFRCTS